MSLHHWAIRFYPFTQYSDFSSLCLNFTLHPTLFPRNQWFGQTSLKRNKFTGDNDFFINQFQANFHCCTPWKRQKTSDLKWENLKWKRDQSQIRNNVFLFFIEPQYAQIVCSAEPVMQIRMRDFVIANVFNSVENDVEDDEEGRLWKGYKLVATFFWLPKNKIEQFFCVFQIVIFFLTGWFQITSIDLLNQTFFVNVTEEKIRRFFIVYFDITSPYFYFFFSLLVYVLV